MFLSVCKFVFVSLFCKFLNFDMSEPFFRCFLTAKLQPSHPYLLTKLFQNVIKSYQCNEIIENVTRFSGF